MFKFIFWLLWDFTGLRFFWEKIRPPIDQNTNTRPPATFMIWAFGILGLYLAIFGLASQRYNHQIDIIENRANAIFFQLATPQSIEAISRIPVVQNMRCPQKPDLMKPQTVLYSLLAKDGNYGEMIDLLKKTVEDWKRSLNNVNLSRVILDGANLLKANLDKSKLHNANFQKADMGLANLQNSSLRNANLQGAFLGLANLSKADLHGANLDHTDLTAANLQEADLENATLTQASLKGTNLEDVRNLTVNQLCAARTLSEAKLDSDLLQKVKEKCPDLL